MATYATYRHVELDNVGCGKKRVLKPPGGGSSDIFGTSDSSISSPRRVNNAHNQSSLGSSFFGDNAANQHQQQQATANGSSVAESPRNKPGNDSYKRLFGPPDVPPPSTPNSKYRMRSNISLSSESSSNASSSSASYSMPQNGHITNGNGYHHNDVVDGNPVTGSGYEAQNGSANGGGSGASSVTSEKSSTDSSPSSGGAPRLKNRVPPGGFSSGLW